MPNLPFSMPNTCVSHIFRVLLEWLHNLVATAYCLRLPHRHNAAQSRGLPRSESILGRYSIWHYKFRLQSTEYCKDESFYAGKR